MEHVLEVFRHNEISRWKDNFTHSCCVGYCHSGHVLLCLHDHVDITYWWVEYDYKVAAIKNFGYLI